MSSSAGMYPYILLFLSVFYLLSGLNLELLWWNLNVLWSFFAFCGVIVAKKE